MAQGMGGCMKFILIPIIWLMIPVAFIFVAFDVAKAAVEENVISNLEKKQ
jgi:hypothetical protein